MGDPGPQIHYHFKTHCSTQTTGKRIFTNSVFMSPWRKTSAKLWHEQTQQSRKEGRNICVFVCGCFNSIWMHGCSCKCWSACVCWRWNGSGWSELSRVSAVMCSTWGFGSADRVTTWLLKWHIASHQIYWLFAQKCAPRHKGRIIQITMCTYIAGDIYGRQAARYRRSFYSRVHN